MATTEPTFALGIRREDKNRWERRAPLAPTHVKELVKRGIKVIVQPSSLRTFADMQYQQAGAIIDEDLSSCQAICSVKEVPTDLLLPKKTYMFFSHTIKAQPVNMHMLDDILAKHIRLIDYECITDLSNKRLVRFGKFAGYAGMIDSLHALGDRLLALGHSTPFLHLGYSYCYSTLETAKEAVKAMGEEIGHYGVPEELMPLTFVFTSQGNVSQGAQDIFRLLPHKMVTPQEMVQLVKNKDKASRFMVYGTVITAEDYAVPNDPKKKFDKSDYYSHPETYHSIFFEEFAPYVSLIMNCTYWDHRYPRIITIDQIRQLVEQKRNRLLLVGDISCDQMGSIEFLMKTTSIDQPLFVYDPLTGECHDSNTDKDYIYKPGILFCAVDNFPTEFPKEATQWFGDHLLPFMELIVKSKFDIPFEQMNDLPPEIHKAVITSHGELTPKFKYITDLRKQREKTMRSILLLGAGYVSKPCLDYLCRTPSNRITIADINVKQAESLAGKRSNIKVLPLDVNDPKSLDDLVSKHNVVISLLPATLNYIVGQSCLRNKKNLVTASYISPQMKQMHEEVQKAGITFLNEIGLDPGIDHLEATRIIEEIHSEGGKVRSFVSWCGGLPRPEFSVNPLGYKFSWSPRGVLGAATKDAKFLQSGKIIDINGSRLFKHAQPIELFPGFSLEGIPNRDATTYIDQYGLTAQDQVHTFFRGTLRYKGFCEVMEAIVEIGLLDDSPKPHLDPKAADITWDKTMRILLGGENLPVKTKQLLKDRLRADFGFPTKGYDDDKIRRIINCFNWLGLFSDKLVNKKGTLVDSLCEILQEKLQYQAHEQDMVILHHTFEAEFPNSHREIRTSTLVAYGEGEVFAMGKTVGLPVAIAAELLLQGGVKTHGVIGPVDPHIYKPILKALNNEGLKFIEKREKLPSHSSK